MDWERLVDDTLARVQQGWRIRLYPSRHRPNKDRVYVFQPAARRAPIEHVPTPVFDLLFNAGLIKAESQDGPVTTFAATYRGVTTLAETP